MNERKKLPGKMEVYTYAEPTVNMTKSPAFFALDIWRFMTMGIGIAMIKTSMMTPRDAVALNKATRSIHLPSVMVISQPMAMGLHEKMELKKIPTVDPTLTKMVNAMDHLNHFD